MCVLNVLRADIKNFSRLFSSSDMTKKNQKKRGQYGEHKVKISLCYT